MYLIKAPKADYNGFGYGLAFVNGVAKTDNKDLAKLLQSKGYFIESLEPPRPQKQKAEEKTSKSE